MKKICLLLSLLPLLTACPSNDKKDAPDPLLESLAGTKWNATKYDPKSTGYTTLPSGTLLINFTDASKFKATDSGSSRSGTYTESKTELVLTYTDKQESYYHILTKTAKVLEVQLYKNKSGNNSIETNIKIHYEPQ